ncbi:MAG: hypothetical protein ACRCTQ_05315 [Brevinemataceae bacterium]
MDRISRIHNIIRWQELYQSKKVILSTYENDEIKLADLTGEFNFASKEKQKLEEQSEILSTKITKEEERLNNILNRIDEMESDRENLKMVRQIKSWEKEIEKLSQDREVLEAQLYYDKSRMGDIVQEIDKLSEQIGDCTKGMAECEKILNEFKLQTKDERERIESEIETISSQFDSHFAEYFERLLSKNNGIVMAVVEEDSCSGCNILLPTSYHDTDILQDEEDSSLLQCPNCFRYLYFSEDI